MRTQKVQRQECWRCGRGIPPRRRDTGFCSDKCNRDQLDADEASVRSEAEHVANAAAHVRKLKAWGA